MSLIPEKHLAPKEEVERRIKICEACPKLFFTRQCAKCFCFIDLKAKLINFHCDLKKW